jgi:hypothetical protein
MYMMGLFLLLPVRFFAAGATRLACMQLQICLLAAVKQRPSTACYWEQHTGLIGFELSALIFDTVHKQLPEDT